MRTLILALALCSPAWLFSQHNHFLYIQSDNQQLFYVKRSGEVLSSSSTGFIILSKLQAGTHQFIIGFPRDQYPEYEYQVELRGRDRGFTLRNTQDKGRVLLDMQSQEIIYGRRIDKAVREPEKKNYGSMSDDLFAVTLASVVNDPGIRETSLVQAASMVSAPSAIPAGKPVAVQPQKPAGPVAAAPKTQTPPAKPASPPASSATTQPAPAAVQAVNAAPQAVPGSASVKAAEKYSPKPIEKISELKTWSGYQITYIDNSGARPDTIQVIIDDGSRAPGNGNLWPVRDPGPKKALPSGEMIHCSRGQIQQRWPDIFLS